MRNYKDEYNNARIESLALARRHGSSINLKLHLSFTYHGKKVFKEMNRKLLEDTELDRELGILDDKEYKTLIDAYTIIESSIASGDLYL